MDRIALPKGKAVTREIRFATSDGGQDGVHLLRRDEIHAVNAAIAAGRPLLVRGEPGVGKSQLARAAAVDLKRAYLHIVIDSRAESRDLMWRFDAVQRLADAQLYGALRKPSRRAHDDLEVEKYVHPGPLWWAFNWEDALNKSGHAAALSPASPTGAIGGRAPCC